MKNSIQNIQGFLNNQAIVTNLQNLKQSNPQYETNETTITEAFDDYLNIKALLEESIEKGVLEDISYTRRNAIFNHLNTIQRYSNNIGQVIPQIIALKDQIQLTNLDQRVFKGVDFTAEAKEITKMKRKYSSIVKNINSIQELRSQINKTAKEIEKTSQITSKSKDKIDEIEKVIAQSQSEYTSKVKAIQKHEQEIENRRKEVISFHTRIQSSEEKLNKIEGDLQKRVKDEIDTKLISAKKLIEEAETALELKQTEGIAKAYSSRLEKLSNTKRNIYWLAGAIFFVVVTLLLGFLIAGGAISIGDIEIKFDPQENIGFIIGRITLTGIGLAGAIFCANRYVTLKNLEEDYEYKVVLSKSILAFSNKISEIDKERLPDYLIRVLDELHQDPLRDRKGTNKNEIDVNTLAKFKDFMNMWSEMNK